MLFIYGEANTAQLNVVEPWVQLAVFLNHIAEVEYCITQILGFIYIVWGCILILYSEANHISNYMLLLYYTWTFMS